MRLYHSLAAVGIAGVVGTAVGHVLTEDSSTTTQAAFGGLGALVATTTYLTPPRGASMATAFWGGIALGSAFNLVSGGAHDAHAGAAA
jgi:hypothetical protein